MSVSKRVGDGFMVKVQKNIIIGRAAHAVWAILDDPVRSSGLDCHTHLLYCYESRVGGYDRVFRYRMGGKSFETGAQMTTYAAGHHMAYKTCGVFQSCWNWWLESDGRQTHVSLTVDYEIPRALVEMDAPTLEQEQEQVIEAQLAKLKQAVETGG
jgi:predicted dehydrogenase